MTTHPTTTAVVDALRAALGNGAVTDRPIDRHAHAHDASHYLLIPDVLVTPSSVPEVAAAMEVCTSMGASLTFRSGGSSLSGQAITDSVMVDTRHAFRGVEVLDSGRRVRVKPGTTVQMVNAYLARYGRKIGPDPASEIACTIGGVVANNSSGMHCGTTANTYRTLESMVFVLPSGTVLDSGAPGASREFAAREPRLHEGLLRMRRRITNHPQSVSTIQRLFSMKNTMGYGINAFLDFEDPLDILTHLIIGSEGTLAFVAEAVFRTLPVHPHVATGLLIFENVTSATSHVPDLIATNTATAELLDAASLRVSSRVASAPSLIRSLEIHDHAALLVEFTGATPEELEYRRQEAAPLLASLPVSRPPELTTRADERAALWKARKGLYSVLAGARPSGTSQLLEDVAVPVAALGRTCAELNRLFEAHGYGDSVIFGHAKDGNIHFMLNEQFDDPQRMKRYEQFTEEMVSLILDRGGTLKAEHGTGRIMAPYVRRQYGEELYEVMQELKRLVDPAGILNPEAVLSDDPKSYLRDLKVTPTVEPEVDRCVECGYCEPVCPSRDLTTTPRQRITLRRDVALARERGDDDLANAIMADYDYESVQTCAVDGMCMTACPVDINTGDLVRRLRAEAAGTGQKLAWSAAAQAWGAATLGGAAALTVAKALPAPLPERLSQLGQQILGPDNVPQYDHDLPVGGRRRPVLDAEEPRAVLFSACIGTMFGPEAGGHTGGSTGAFIKLCYRAGVPLRTPKGLGGLCCGTPWKSKGIPAGWDAMRRRVLTALVQATEQGRLPVVVDASSCAEGIVAMLDTVSGVSPNQVVTGAERLKILDVVEFTAQRLLDRLRVTAPVPSIAVHPTCSAVLAGNDDAIGTVARFISDEVIIPVHFGCCGFAGDRGMLHPELTAAATAPETADLAREEAARGGAFTEYVSSNRTCEIGMTRATGRPYRHVLEVLEAATRP